MWRIKFSNADYASGVVTDLIKVGLILAIYFFKLACQYKECCYHSSSQIVLDPQPNPHPLKSTKLNLHIKFK